MIKCVLVISKNNSLIRIDMQQELDRLLRF